MNNNQPPHLLFILNPVAGNARADELRLLLQEQCELAAATFDVYETSGQDRLKESSHE